MNTNIAFQKLLIKVLNKTIVDKFHTELSKNSISHTDVSIQAGKSPTAFNKNFNSCDQLTLASFLRFSYAACNLSNTDFYTSQFSLQNILTNDELILLDMICNSKDTDLDKLNETDILFLKHFKMSFDYLKTNGKLTKDEIYCFENYIIKKDVF